MADYIQQQAGKLVRADLEKRYVDRQAAEENDRYNRAVAASNKTGAGRGGRGGPTAAESAEMRPASAAPKSYADAEHALTLTSISPETKDSIRRGIASDKKEGLKNGGSVSASRRGDGIAQRGKTKGRMC